MYKKWIYILFLLFLEPVFALEPYSPEWVMYFQNYVVNRQANQSVIFNALNLSDEQRKQFLKITKQDDIIYKKEFENLLKESYQLENLQTKKVFYGDILKQKKNIKLYVKQIRKIAKQEDKELRKILTREQRSKYSMIKKLERHDLKQEIHSFDYYKKNPQLTRFGDEKLYFKNK